jgi:chromosomal replication initiator protein
MEQASDQQMWERTLAQLKDSVDEESFATWIRPARFVAIHDNTLLLAVPSTFHRNWLSSNYREKILGALRQVSSLDLDLALDVVETGVGEPTIATDLPVPAEPMAEWGSAPAAATMAPSTVSFPRPSSLNFKYTFDSFVVGESNRFAHAACRQVADPASKSYNPLFIYGGVGLGKTHLMHAIGHNLVQSNPRAQVLYVTSEQFMNSFIEAISQGKQSEFRDFYRKVDLLMIDDVQFFSGKERTQTEFFHTFNALYDASKKIVLSSDRPPKELSTLEDRLRNRFSWGLVVDIQSPDLETRIAILKKKALSDSTDLPNEVAVYIAERIQSNIRELEGILMRLRAYSQLHRLPITLEMAKSVLGHLLVSEMPKSIDLEEIIEVVCTYFELKRADLLGGSRLKKFSYPRHIAQYLARTMTNLSYPDIAERFGGRDHTSILHAFRKIEEEASQDENLQNLVNYLAKRIRTGHSNEIP